MLIRFDIDDTKIEYIMYEANGPKDITPGDSSTKVTKNTGY